MIEWLFHSPRRLATVFAAFAFTAVLGISLALNVGHRTPAGPRPIETASPTLMNPAQAQEAARAFVDLWCQLAGRTPEQWASDLQDRSTPDLAAQWSVNQTTNLSGACVWGASTTRWIDASSALFAVPTKRGRPVLVRVIQAGDRVLVASIGDDDQGDV